MRVDRFADSGYRISSPLPLVSLCSFETLPITAMNFEIFLQLAAVLFIFSAGPLVIILLASKSGNL